jgi:hypothetical protein
MKTKDNEIHDLLKIPDSVIISELRIELGKQASYIQELEDEIRLLRANDRDSIEEKRKIRKDEVCTEYKKRIKVLEDIAHRFRKDNELLIIKLNSK